MATEFFFSKNLKMVNYYPKVLLMSENIKIAKTVCTYTEMPQKKYILSETEWRQTSFGLIIGFIAHLYTQLVNTLTRSLSHTDMCSPSRCLITPSNDGSSLSLVSRHAHWIPCDASPLLWMLASSDTSFSCYLPGWTELRVTLRLAIYH
jgi:hypothetical protein